MVEVVGERHGAHFLPRHRVKDMALAVHTRRRHLKSTESGTGVSAQNILKYTYKYLTHPKYIKGFLKLTSMHWCNELWQILF